jgi:hypothetical protein
MVLIARSTPRRLLVFGAVLFAASYATIVGNASASLNEWSGKNLPGHSWTTGNGVVQSALWRVDAGARTTSDVCAGPVTHNAEGYHFPYGWSCNGGEAIWRIEGRIEAAAGLDNPNSGTFTEYWGVGFSE